MIESRGRIRRRKERWRKRIKIQGMESEGEEMIKEQEKNKMILETNH
jgi:hypothetical protein